MEDLREQLTELKEQQQKTKSIELFDTLEIEINRITTLLQQV